MPAVTPILQSAVPAPTASGADPATFAAANPGTGGRPVVLVPAVGGCGDGVDVKFAVQNAVVAVRPWAWVSSTDLVTFPSGGWWAPIGWDSVSGPKPATANPASGNATAWGRFQDADAGGRYWMLVVETGVVANVLGADLSVVRRSVVTS